jgi:hypothetical protein
LLAEVTTSEKICWHVLQTKARQAKALARSLDAVGIEHYLPLIRRERFRSPWVRRAVMRLAENSTLDLDPDGIRHMLDAPTTTGHELGMLITAAWAARAVESVAAELRSPSPRVAA